MPTVLITGANRGIGLEFARQYHEAGWHVVATTRAKHPDGSPELEALGVRVQRDVDLSNPDSVIALANNVLISLDLLIANAGTSDPKTAETAQDALDWQRMMMVNAISPYVLARRLLPQVARANGKMIAISSGMGSIGDNGGGWVPYRTSKAALNMAWNSLALEAKPRGVAVVALSPGWVKTDMGGAGAEITPQESVAAMRELIDRLTLDDSGKFLRRDGSPLPW